MADDISDRVRVRELKLLSDNHYTLRRAEYDWRRSDGRWQERQQRESYDIGDAAMVLPWDKARDRVILIRQFRWPVFEWGVKELLVEAVAGKLDGDDPAACVMREAMEEAGVAITNSRLVTHAFTSAGAVKERCSIFLADYDSTLPRARGGGQEDEGEDIEVLELPLDRAYAMIASGGIIEAKTALLLMAAKLET